MRPVLDLHYPGYWSTKESANAAVRLRLRPASATIPDMDGKALGLFIFYCACIPTLLVCLQNYLSCRREGREMHWFLSALSHMALVLLALAPLMIYSTNILITVFAYALLIIMIPVSIYVRFFLRFKYRYNPHYSWGLWGRKREATSCDPGRHGTGRPDRT